MLNQETDLDWSKILRYDQGAGAFFYKISWDLIVEKNLQKRLDEMGKEP